MARFVAFLRGLNVGGHRVKMDVLRARLEAMDFTDVRSFLASGNVIFDADGDAADITQQIEEDLQTGLGYEVLTFLRSAAEVQAIAGFQPFPRDVVDGSRGKLQVILLRDALPAAVRRQVERLSTDDDRLAIEGREVFWLPAGGTQESDLDLAVVEGLRGPVTVRTKNTIDRIAARL